MRSTINCIRIKKTAALALLALCINLLTPLAANALPAFARQTGQNCVACHAGGQFPELTPYGRLFKLTGYTMGSRTIPISAMGLASLTKSLTPTSDPGFAKDADLIFQTGSVFLAGKITDNVGIFAQATYNNYSGDSGIQGVWGSDNFDFRYADRFISPTNDVIFGVSLNNNPSVTDVWNSAPAWIIYAPTQFGVTGPDAGPIITSLGAQVAGVNAYVMWNNLLYAEIGGYKTANGVFSFLSQGTNDLNQTKLSGTNPYARVALTHEWGAHNIMVGAFGLNANIYPDPTNQSGPTIHYKDRGIDAQYQYLLDPETISAQFSYIRETINNGDATGIALNPSNTLTTLRIKGTYIYQAKYGSSLSFFKTSGTSDTTLYTTAPSGSPNTRGITPELFWMPIQNIRVGLQYYAYQQFDGASTNYDGNGRNAKDNNTAFLYVWGAY